MGLLCAYCLVLYSRCMGFGIGMALGGREGGINIMLLGTRKSYIDRFSGHLFTSSARSGINIIQSSLATVYAYASCNAQVDRFSFTPRHIHSPGASDAKLETTHL